VNSGMSDGMRVSSVANALVLLALLTSTATAASDPADATDDRGPASAALTVSITEAPDVIRLHIQASGDVEAGSVEVRFSGRKMVVLARDAKGRPIRSPSLRLPEPVVEEGSSAEYDADGALVMTLRKQATAARPTREPEATVR